MVHSVSAGARRRRQQLDLYLLAFAQTARIAEQARSRFSSTEVAGGNAGVGRVAFSAKRQPGEIAVVWSLNRLSRLRPKRLMGDLGFRLPCGRCQLCIWGRLSRRGHRPILYRTSGSSALPCHSFWAYRVSANVLEADFLALRLKGMRTITWLLLVRIPPA